MQRPLARLRIVVTIPPYAWFGGVDYNFAIEMSEELRALGAEVFELDLYGFVYENEPYIEQAVAAAKRFGADVAVSLPNAGYALIARTRDRRNVFTDILRIPTIMLWDHGLLQFPRIILSPLPDTPEHTRDGCIRRLSQALDHDLYVHYSPDRGHIAELDRLGVIGRDRVHFYLQPAYPNYVRHGYRAFNTNAFRSRVAFAGNVYLQGSRSLSFAGHPVLDEIAKRVAAAKFERLTDCLWDLFLEELEGLDEHLRAELHLQPDSSFFWKYMHDQIEVAGNTSVRLHVLSGLKYQFDFFGNFIEPESASTLRSQYNITVRKSLDYFSELPLLFVNSDVIVDIINLGYNTGISPKMTGCMACGGLVLFDYKDDFRNSVGDAADEVMYTSVDHLNGMVENYLSQPRRRADVSRYLQQLACTKFSFRALCIRLFVDEPLWRYPRSRHAPIESQSTTTSPPSAGL
jgi:hypothetical protein